MISETRQNEASVVPSTGKPENLLWHYTIGYHLPEIIRTGAILPSIEFVPATERPVVWFSSNQEWEHSCDRGNKQLDMESLPDYVQEEIDGAKKERRTARF
jgi:hypothetical protein